MGKNKSSDMLRQAGKHNDSHQQKYGHEHYEQIPFRGPSQPDQRDQVRESHDKGNPTKNKGR